MGVGRGRASFLVPDNADVHVIVVPNWAEELKTRATKTP